jgi:KipI family sensor histidine kinase inhibitor
MKMEICSDSAVLVRFGDAVSNDSFRAVMALFRQLEALHESRIRNIHPAYASVLIDFDPLRMSHEELGALIEQLVLRQSDVATDAPIVRIPVCYDIEFGIDLPFVAEHCGLTEHEVIRLHCSTDYVVHFIGFSPGFGYLGGLPSKLEVPRLEAPRKHVVAGSVGIAGSQAGVYPVDSPGGWRLLGRTPLRMFDPVAQPPTRLQPGNIVRFDPIDRKAFDELAAGEHTW